MATINGGDKLEARLKALADKIARPGTLRVGFLEGATYPDGTPVALVAAIQNFGAPARGIPPRPFFSNMVRRYRNAWGDQLAAILKNNEGDVELSLKQMGEGIAGQLRTSIVETNAPALAPQTIAAKGFEKPLVNSGQMLASVDYEVDMGESVSRGTDKPKGLSDEDYAAAQAERQQNLRSRAIGRGVA